MKVPSGSSDSRMPSVTEWSSSRWKKTPAALMTSNFLPMFFAVSRLKIAFNVGTLSFIAIFAVVFDDSTPKTSYPNA